MSAGAEPARGPPESVLRGGIIAGAALAVLAVVGAAVGIAVAFSRTRSTAIDPSEKARLLAQGISEVMNFLVLGIVGTLVGIVVAIVCAVVRSRRRRRSKADRDRG